MGKNVFPILITMVRLLCFRHIKDKYFCILNGKEEENVILEYFMRSDALSFFNGYNKYKCEI